MLEDDGWSLDDHVANIQTEDFQNVLQHPINTLSELDAHRVLEALRQGAMDAVLQLQKPLVSAKDLGKEFHVSARHLLRELPKKVPTYYIVDPKDRNSRSRKLFARKDVETWLAANKCPAMDVRRHLGEFINDLTKRRK